MEMENNIPVEQIPEEVPEVETCTAAAAEEAEVPEITVEESVPAQEEPVETQTESKKVMKWWVWAIIAVIVVALGLTIISAVKDEDSSSSSSSSSGSAPVIYENPYVTIVKTTTNSKYGVTYGAAFNSFFANPKWSYFSATTGENVVEFEGGFLYDGSPATATFQIVVDMDEGMLTVHHLSINGVGQSNLILATMLQKVFESY